MSHLVVPLALPAQTAPKIALPGAAGAWQNLPPTPPRLGSIATISGITATHILTSRTCPSPYHTCIVQHKTNSVRSNLASGASFSRETPLLVRVALLTEGPENVGSTYWRALQHAPRLARHGIELDPLIPPTIEPRLPNKVGKVAYFGEHAARYIGLGARLRRRLNSYDAVYAQRGAYPMGPAWVAEALERFRGRVVFDLDDNVFAPSPSLSRKSRAARWLYGDQQARYLLKRADTVIVSTEELANALPGRRADFVLPTVPDVADYPTVSHRDAAPIRIGWIGNPGNLIYLDPLADVFRRLQTERVADFEVVSPVPWKGPAIHRPWRRAEEVSALATFDVGIMPLPDTPYTRAKAGFKMLMYMGVGSAVVASPVGINRQLLASSRGGIAASTTEEWEAALRTLAAGHRLRAEMGRAGQRFVRSYANLDEHVAQIKRALVD